MPLVIKLYTLKNKIMKISIEKAQFTTKVIFMLGVLACLLSIVYLIATNTIIHPNQPKPFAFYIFLWGMPVSGLFGLASLLLYLRMKRTGKELATEKRHIVRKDIKIPAKKFS